jgi:hypothetical protein
MAAVPAMTVSITAMILPTTEKTMLKKIEEEEKEGEEDKGEAVKMQESEDRSQKRWFARLPVEPVCQ